MNTHTAQDKENDRRAAAIAPAQLSAGKDSTFRFADHRPEAVAQRKLQEMVDNAVSHKAPPLQRKANKTGLPDNLKSGVENLSGLSMDDVRVHRNSDKPAQLNAHAYAQGTDIHLASGQEKHLPHEAWHVVQQKQGRVKPTMQLKGKVPVNDDVGLEREADLMGGKAMQFIPNHLGQSKSESCGNSRVRTIQRLPISKGGFTADLENNRIEASGEGIMMNVSHRRHGYGFIENDTQAEAKNSVFPQNVTLDMLGDKLIELAINQKTIVKAGKNGKWKGWEFETRGAQAHCNPTGSTEGIVELSPEEFLAVRAHKYFMKGVFDAQPCAVFFNEAGTYSSVRMKLDALGVSSKDQFLRKLEEQNIRLIKDKFYIRVRTGDRESRDELVTA